MRTLKRRSSNQNKLHKPLLTRCPGNYPGHLNSYKMDYTIFSDKEMLKQDKELVELHKRCCKSYLIQHSLKHSKIKKFFIVYDWYINTDNVRNFFFRPINLFIQALLLGQLDEISDYINPNKNGKRKKKRTRKV